jgi:DNA repair protein RadC
MYSEKKTGIRYWAEEDQPRYKFVNHGKKALSDAELLAILIATGHAEESALDLGRRILQNYGNNLDAVARLTPGDITRQFKGIGEAKAIKILAALELGARRWQHETQRVDTITDAKSAFSYLYPRLCDLGVEVFYVLYLNRRNQVIHHKLISQGGIHGTVVDIRVVLKEALHCQASGLILAHNHPSGQLQPSPQDITLTKKLQSAAIFMEMQVIDHIIVAGRSYFSFADEGKL